MTGNPRVADAAAVRVRQPPDDPFMSLLIRER